MHNQFGLATVLLTSALAFPACAQDTKPLPVNVHNFARAETDVYFASIVKRGSFGKLGHARSPSPIDKQNVVRENRDTLYSSGVFDLDAGSVTITLPDPGKRYMSMLIVSEDHYVVDMVYAPGRFTVDKDKAGTRYAFVLIRTLANAENPTDVSAANRLQDAIKIEQASAGKFEMPNWDKVSQNKAREALSALGELGNIANRFGKKSEVDPFDHLIGTAIGWGGLPRSAADYQSFYPPKNDGKTVYRLTLKDVPVDGFWSVSLYNAKGFFEKNPLNAYSLNNLTAKPDADGAYTIQFGGCENATPNCLPTTKGWNYTVRLYRPRTNILDGSWRVQEAQPARNQFDPSGK
jgi:hypothetical protein